MCRSMKAIDARLEPLRQFAEHWLTPLVLLAMRLAVSKAFFTSGKLKLGYVLNNQLDTLYFLFQDYNVPLLPVKVAAWMGMCGELGLSALLALGLFSRFGALGLIVMSGIIFHTDGNILAPYWALICALIAVHGPGKLALDNVTWKK